MFRRMKEFVGRHERGISAAAFLLGFLWDNLTLSRIDRLYDNLVLAGYLVAAFAAIVLVNAHGARGFQNRLALRGVGLAQFLLPFAFGGLFSGFLIFYSRSGPVLTSAPFFLVLGAFFVGNELFRRHYERFVFQMTVFFVALFSYAALIMPVILRRMGGAVFVLAGVTAFILFFLAVQALSFVAKEEVARSRALLRSIAIIIFILFNALYFNSMIPPIPLSLRNIGVYHSLLREQNGAYRGTFEPAPWYALHRNTAAVFHIVEREPAFVFSSVYAPTDLETEVVHRWEYLDEAKGKWLLINMIRFPISGGRREGYRGYSVKENIQAGKWRVSVETLRGQTIGQFTFIVLNAVMAPALTAKTL